MKPKNVIQLEAPNDTPEWTWSPRCARCGSSMEWHECTQCDDGFDGHDCGDDCCCCACPEDNVPCGICDGAGGWLRCMSSGKWCGENPLPGREKWARDECEWQAVKLIDAEATRFSCS